MTVGQGIRFDGWSLRRDTGELHRGDVRLRLQAQPLQVLEALLERPGEMVTREQLIARLWPRGVVDFDTALNSAVRRLRIALGDHADAPRYIETIPKRGYRFIGRVECDTTEPDDAQVGATRVASGDTPHHGNQRAGRLGRRGIVAAAAGVGLVAVLVLAGAWLRPAWRADGAIAVAAVAEAQSAVSAQARALEQEGRFLLQRRGPGDVAEARERFEAALAIEPRYARAWSGIASAHWIDTVELRAPPEEGLAATRHAAESALRIDRTVAEAHVRLANWAWRTGRHELGEAHLRQAMTVGPTDALVLSVAASEAAERGAFAEAIAVQRRVVEAEPLSKVARHNLASFMLIAGHHEEARRVLEDVLTLDPDARDVESLLGQALILDRDFDAALRIAKGVGDDAARLHIEALAYHGLGDADRAQDSLRSLAALVQGRREYLLAEVHAFRGEPDLAFEHLAAATRAAAQRCDGGCWPVAWLPASPLLEPLRRDARWTPWLADLRRQIEG
jgi:DNA-binding winged helix-turn-helix (wHTH) protein/tetratricopeptide (TPR) repeat protein